MDYKVEKLGGYINEISRRNRDLNVSIVFSVTNSEGFIKSTDYFDKEVFSKNISNYKIVNHNQFAYNPSRINVGSIDYLKSHNEVIISPLYVVFSCNDKLHEEILKIFLKSPLGNYRIRSKTRGAVRDTLSFTSLSEIKIPIPVNYSDQIRIAMILNKAGVLIKQRKDSIVLLDELLKSSFLQIFGDPVRNERGWEKKELFHFGEISTGNTPPRSIADYYSENFIEWIKTDNISEDQIFVTKANEYLSEVGVQKGRIIKDGALLVACIAGSIESIGRAALTNRNVAYNQQINAIQPNEDVLPLYLYWLFKLSRKYIQNHATKGMKKILTKGVFEKIKMIKPPKDIQIEFTIIAEKIVSLKTEYNNSLNELENLYSSLSQLAFKGTLDLSGLNIEHIVPLSAGGSDSFENLTVVPLKSNKKLSWQFKSNEKGKLIFNKYYEYDIAQIIKNNFFNFDFTFQDIVLLFKRLNKGSLEYYSSQELKSRELEKEDDIKSFLFDCIEGKCEYLKLAQKYYNALDDLELKNISL